MKVYSIFSSINGEICYMYQGSICTFVRLAGCSVDCNYCDTTYARDSQSGKEEIVADIVTTINQLGNNFITITGGEPLEQLSELMSLIEVLLLDKNKLISVETSGEIYFDRRQFDEYRTTFVVDIKLHKERNWKYYEALHLKACDTFKIVISNVPEFHQACQIKKQLQESGCKAKFAFSTLWDSRSMSAQTLLGLIQNFGIKDVILNVQLHKLLKLKEDN